MHARLLTDLGCQVMAVTRKTNRHKTLPNFDSEDDLSMLVRDGYTHCVICTSDTVLGVYLRKAIDAGFKHIFIEKPVAATSSQLLSLVDYAEKKRVNVMVGY